MMKVKKIRFGAAVLNISFFVFVNVVLFYKYKIDSTLIGSLNAFLKYLPYVVIILLLEGLISLFTIHSDVWQ
jgi:hypothetical protein